jgi:hypothetical protein
MMTRSAPYEKSKFLGSGGSMVARLKLKEIDGRAPQGVNRSTLRLKAAGKGNVVTLKMLVHILLLVMGNTLKVRETPRIFSYQIVG